MPAIPGTGVINGGVVGAVITILVGVLILVYPRIVASIIGIYLIIVGILALLAVVR